MSTRSYYVNGDPINQFDLAGTDSIQAARHHQRPHPDGRQPYDPSTGGFLQVDPKEGGSSNAYDYVSGDPVNDFDLNGLCKKHHGFFGHIRDAGCHTGNVGRGVGRGVARGARATVRFTRDHIGDIGTGVGCGLGIAGAETGVGLALAAATCGTAIGLGVAGHRTGSASFGRAGVGYGCAAGFLVAFNPVSFLAAAAGCVNGVGFQALDEREGG